MLSPSDISALIKMLDDPDEEIANKIINQLSNTGKETISSMQEIWETNLLEIVDSRILEIEHRIKLNDAIAFFKNWHESNDKNVFEAWLYLSELFDPTFDKSFVMDSINKIRFDTWIEYNDNLTTIEKCKILTSIFEQKHHISLSTNPTSLSYLISSIVLEKQSARSSMAILFQHIASLLNIDLFGLNFFEYGVLGYFNPNSAEEKKREDILFYLIFADKIHIIGNHQLDLGLNIDDASLYTPSSSVQIIHKILYGLKLAFIKENSDWEANTCQEILELLKKMS